MDPCAAIQTPEPGRRSGNYSPSVWGDFFLRYASISDEDYPEEGREHERLRDEVKKLLISEASETFDLIDTIQRLGISYHFEKEIEASVPSMLEQFRQDDSDDLCTVALRFRLLRQLGHHVSCGVLNKFKGPEGAFKESLITDVNGLLSLFEAANFMVADEDILEEALNFTTSKLESILPNLDDLILVSRIKQALDFPIQRTVTSVGARLFISTYEEDESHDHVLLHFAKLDFNKIQRIRQKELSTVTEWWKKFDVKKNAPFTRDRLVESYLWKMFLYSEPKYSQSCTVMTKVVALTGLMDDLYDTYGTFDELIVFTHKLECWDISALDELPPYMRPIYQVLIEVFSEMEKGWSGPHKAIPMTYGVSWMRKGIRAYFDDAALIHSGHLPPFEELMEIALATTGFDTLVMTSLVSLGDQFVCEDDLAWVAKNPSILEASTLICRLMDDIGDHEEDLKNGQVANTVECYMRHYGASKEKAVDELEKNVRNAWKDINKGWLDGSASGVPKFVMEPIINLAKFMHYFYREIDGFTHSSTFAENLVQSVLIDPIKI